MDKILAGMIFLVVLFATLEKSSGITHDQFLESVKLMRKACQPKFKVPDELANKLSLGIFPEDKNLKCYVNCFLEMAQTMKRGKVNFAAASRQIDVLLPDNMKDHYRAALEACKNVVKGIKDNCEASYAFLKCTKDNNPSYEFP